MFDKFLILPFKQKKQILILACLFMVTLFYFLAFQPTIDAISENHLLNNRGSIAVTKSTIKILEDKLNEIDLSLKSNEKDKDDLRKKILERIAHKCNTLGLKIIHIPESTSINQTGFTIIFNNFEVLGDFEKLNRLLYDLENEVSEARVVASHFISRKNRKSKQKELTLSVYFQSIIFDSNE